LCEKECNDFEFFENEKNVIFWSFFYEEKAELEHVLHGTFEKTRINMFAFHFFASF
jgi:hypothetical protein